MNKPTNGLSKSGSLIKQIGEQYGLTQAELVSRIGGKWDKTRLSKVESNSLPLSRPVVHDIANALEMRPERLYLMCFKEEYPALQDGEVGELLSKIVESLDPSDVPPMGKSKKTIP